MGAICIVEVDVRAKTGVDKPSVQPSELCNKISPGLYRRNSQQLRFNRRESKAVSYFLVQAGSHELANELFRTSSWSICVDGARRCDSPHHIFVALTGKRSRGNIRLIMRYLSTCEPCAVRKLIEVGNRAHRPIDIDRVYAMNLPGRVKSGELCQAKASWGNGQVCNRADEKGGHMKTVPVN